MSHADIIRRSLISVTPARGIAVFLCRHPTGAYFPLEIGIGDAVPEVAGKIMRHYYLYSVLIDEVTKPTDLLLNEDSSPEEIILRGKLATRFLQPPVMLNYWPCDAEGKYILCTMTEYNTVTRHQRLPAPETWILENIVDAARLWTQSDRLFLADESESIEELIRKVSRYLADSEPGPPFIPCIHARVDVKAPDKKHFTKGNTISNVLTYNCFLLSCFAQLRESYIDDMVMRDGTGTYTQEIPSTANSLVKAVYKVCYDQIATLATVDKTQERIFGRLNIRRKSAGPNVITYLRTKMQPKLWDAVNFGLRYLEGDHPKTALVTVWAGRYLKGKDKPEYALPVGFAVGEDRTALASVADQEMLEGFKHLKEGKGVQIQVLWPDIRTKTKDQQSRLRECGENQIDLLIRAVEQAVSSSSYPGPYVLDFQKTYDKPLLIRQESAGRGASCREIFLTQDMELYTFLLDLCQLEGEIVDNNGIANLFKCSADKVQSHIDRMRKVLRHHDKRFPIEPRDLFECKKTRGWRIVLDKSSILNLPHSVGAKGHKFTDKEGIERSIVEYMEDEKGKTPLENVIIQEEEEDNNFNRDNDG